jgi:hypothetical protein
MVKTSIFDADPELLERAADTYDFNNQIIRPGYSGEGSPVIAFSNQLKYDAFPFARLLKRILSLGEQTMGSSVEIEFAGNFQLIPNKKTTFYLLQIRPYTQYNVLLDDEHVDATTDKILVKSSLASGNRIFRDIKDVIFVKPNAFDKLKTLKMVAEIDEINKSLTKEKIPYILIGFGRWGTFDHSLGIPVKWHNISGSQVMIEAGLEDFQIEHSQGSHFFQNITTANVGYLYINYKSEADVIDWDWLMDLDFIKEDKQYFRHVRLPKPFYIRVDGVKREGTIIKPDL